jgi:hypothetical protein
MTLDELLAALRNTRDTPAPFNEIYAAIERASHAGNVAFLTTLIDELEATSEQPSHAKHVAMIAFRALALIPHVDAAYATVARARRCKEPTLVAAALAEAHAITDLVALDPASRNDAAEQTLLAMWLHEAVYHGASIAAHPALVAFDASLRSLGGWMQVIPSTMTATEASLRRISPGVRVRSHASWGLIPPRPDMSIDARRAHTVEVSEVIDDAWLRRVRAAFVPEGVLSNAKVEARRYHFGVPIDASWMGAPLLRALAPDCITAPTAPDDRDVHTPPPHDPAEVEVRTARTGADALIATLLQLAIGWRCYGTYAGVGAGRARAWEALGAMAAMPPGSAPSAIEAALVGYQVVAFEASSRWFDHVCEDHGFLLLDRQRRTLTLVAETDSD